MLSAVTGRIKNAEVLSSFGCLQVRCSPSEEEEGFIAITYPVVQYSQVFISKSIHQGLQMEPRYLVMRTVDLLHVGILRLSMCLLSMELSFSLLFLSLLFAVSGNERGKHCIWSMVLTSTQFQRVNYEQIPALRVKCRIQLAKVKKEGFTVRS